MVKIIVKNCAMHKVKLSVPTSPQGTLSSKKTNIKLGKWGMLHKDYLLKHKKVLFTTLLTQGKLYQHCAETEKQAQQMFDMLVEQMKATEGVTEELKEENQMEWCREWGILKQELGRLCVRS